MRSMRTRSMLGAFLRRGLPFLFLVVMCSCAGYRRGVESRVDASALEDTDVELIRRGAFNTHNMYYDKLVTPGISITTDVRNKIKTHQSCWFGILIPMIPFQWDGTDVKHNYRETDHRLQIRLEPHVKGYSFTASKVKLTVGGKVYHPVDIIVKYAKNPPSDINEVFELRELNKSCYVTLVFNAPTPHPDQHIELDLSEALVNPSQKPLPPIIFKKRSWSHWYG